jgi:methyl-accepting chemotaxis protein
VPMAQAHSPAPRQDPPGAVVDPAREIIALVHGDLLHTVRAVADANLDLRANLQDQAELIASIETASTLVQTSSDQARGNVASLHVRLTELTEAGAEIRNQAQQSRSLITVAAERTADVSGQLDRLKASTRDISNAVRLILRKSRAKPTSSPSTPRSKPRALATPGGVLPLSHTR